jgi:integrase
VKDDGFLFPSKGGAETMTVAAISRAVARNLDHFGIPKFTPHDLRRTGSTQLAAFKVPRFDRDRVLNHTDQSIGSVYDIHEYQDEKRAALNLWADIVLNSATAKDTVDVKALQKKLKYLDYLSA